MSTLAERQAEFCGYLLAGAPAYGLPGLPMRSSAAIGGNATRENRVLPTTEGAKDHESDAALQWRKDRLARLKTLPAWDTLKTQAEFTLLELHAKEGTQFFDMDYSHLLLDLTAGAKSLETLTLNFCDAFERPSAAGRAADERIVFAHACLSIMMRDLPSTHTSTPPLPGVPTMPTSIEMAVLEQLAKAFAPMIESAVAGLIKGWITHVPGASVTSSGMITIDPAALEKMIEAGILKLQSGKPAIGPNT